MRLFKPLPLIGAALLAFPLVTLHPMDQARVETRVDEAVRKFGVSGKDVLVAIFDRGIDWKNNDFRNADGTTRIEGILDFSDNTGANDSRNKYKRGTLYSKQQINGALTGGTPLAHRDAVGHGTTTTGIAAGNGRDSRDWQFRGVAPKARIFAVKIVGGAPAHDDQPVEAPYYSGDVDIRLSIDAALDKAAELSIPVVMLPNIGSVAGPMDGSSITAKKVDASVGPGKAGRVFITGSSDDGGLDNHAAATLGQGQTLSLEVEKLDTGSLRLELWYPDTDRYDVTIQTPRGSIGPYVSPATNSAESRQPGVDLNYIHQGSGVTFYGPTTRRMIQVNFSGGAGRYVIELRATTSTGGKFDAWLNGGGRFLNHIVPGYTVWEVAAAANNITPNNYVLRDKWVDVNGFVAGKPDDHVGDLWAGSGIGPTADGRLGVDISAPGNSLVTTWAPNSTWPRRVQQGNIYYSGQSAVSAAAPQVTGIVALMLEMNPTLDASQVRDILRQTARRDDFTGAVPNTRWGYGKVDALEAVTRASQMPGAKPYFSADKNVLLFDAPQGSATVVTDVVTLTPGNGAGAFTTASSTAWLTVNAVSGTAPVQLTVRVDKTGLAIGDYSGEITVNSADGKAVPQTLMVHLHVRTDTPLISRVDDGAAFGPGFANGSWVTIRGNGLANTTRVWQGSDFVGNALPTALDGVSVTIQGRPALVYFISPTQLNVLAPDNTQTNARLTITVRNNGVNSNPFIANSRARNPEFFRFDGRYIAAVHQDGTLVGKVDLFPGLAMRPVKTGDSIQLYGTGCGTTNPAMPADRIVTGAAPVTGAVTLTIGGKLAATSFVGLSGSGLCQINAQIPELPRGDVEVVLKIDNFTSADGAFLTVQ
jgi:minor extracellular serine protease Vpr